MQHFTGNEPFWADAPADICDIWQEGSDVPMSPVLTSALHALPKITKWWSWEGDFPAEPTEAQLDMFKSPGREFFYYTDKSGYHGMSPTQCPHVFNIWFYGCSMQSAVNVFVYAPDISVSDPIVPATIRNLLEGLK